MILCGLTALLLGLHKADRQRVFNDPVPHTISSGPELGPGQRGGCERNQGQQLAVRCNQPWDSSRFFSVHLPFLPILGFGGLFFKSLAPPGHGN